MVIKYFGHFREIVKRLFNESLMLFIVIALIVVSAGLSFWRNPTVGSVEFAPPKLVNDSICVAWQNQFSSARSTLYSVNGALNSQADGLNIDVDGRAITLSEGFTRSFSMTPGSSDRVLADGKDSPLLSNFVFASEAPKNMAGFALDVCRAPQSIWWFNGITTTAGYGATLVMVNPDNTDTVVSVEAFSESGQYELGENRRLVIPGASTRIIDLSEVMPGVKSASISIKSLDGRIVANVQSEVIKGLKSRGRSYITPVQDSAKEVVITRIPITAKYPKLHLLATDGDAVIRVTAHTASGDFVLEGLNGFLLNKEVQKVVDLTRAQSGEALSLTITSDKPVLASASYFSRNNGLGDYEVVTGLPAIKAHTTFVVPTTVPKTTLILGSKQDVTLEVTLRMAGVVKWTQNVSIPAGDFLTQPLTSPLVPGSVITIQSQGGDFYATAIFMKQSRVGQISTSLQLIDPESQVSRGVRLTLAIS
jgi:hypothetical protein